MKGVNKSINISKNNNLSEIEDTISDNVDKTLSNTNSLEDILNSGGLACIIENQEEPPFATFNVSVTYINNSFKFIIHDLTSSFLYANKKYRFNVENYTNFGHDLRFSKSPITQEIYNTTFSGTSGFDGAYVDFTPDEIGSVYMFCIPHGYNMGSLYNPISILSYILPETFITINTTITYLPSGYKFIFNNEEKNFIRTKTYYKFDVSDSTNQNYYLRFSTNNENKI